MRVQLRIVAGSLRGRKLNCTVSPGLRPAPQMLREAMFSILGDAVPQRDFYDLFAGTGAVGLEALSRGARSVTLVERDFRTAHDIDQHIKEFGILGRARVIRADVYRWVDRWHPEDDAVNVFIGPPFPDFDHRTDALMNLIGTVQLKLPPGSILTVQAEDRFDTALLPLPDQWELRKYSRNILALWIKHAVPANP